MQPEVVNAKVKTVFLYNFTKYIEWPKAYKIGNFVVAVLGSNSYLLGELNKMAESKTVGSQKFEINSISSFDKNKKCHMLYISPEQEVNLPEIVKKLKGSNTLIITEKQGMVKQGAAINFIVQNSKQKFELSKTNAEKFDLKISSNLVSLAIVVD